MEQISSRIKEKSGLPKPQPHPSKKTSERNALINQLKSLKGLIGSCTPSDGTAFALIGCMLRMQGEGAMQMGFVLYPGKEPQTAAGLVSGCVGAPWKSRVEVCLSLENLIDRLLQVPISCEVVVAVTDCEELEQLAATWKRLLPPKLILVLRRWEEKTLRVAFELCPSFLTSLEDSLNDVFLVLERLEANRMLGREDGTVRAVERQTLDVATASLSRRGRL